MGGVSFEVPFVQIGRRVRLEEAKTEGRAFLLSHPASVGTFRLAKWLSRDKITSPRICFPNGSMGRFWRRVVKARAVMPERQRARAIGEAHLTRATTRQFDVALHGAATSSIASMTLLHHAICDCVSALKDADVGAVDMILAMKACASDSASRYRPAFDEVPVSNVACLMDQIVRWSIAEYYRTSS